MKRSASQSNFTSYLDNLKMRNERLCETPVKRLKVRILTVKGYMYITIKTYDPLWLEFIFARYAVLYVSKSPFTHTDFSGKLPVNCRKEIMCEQDLFKNTGKFVPAIYQYEKL